MWQPITVLVPAEKGKSKRCAALWLQSEAPLMRQLNW
jgi:hypothetical protein